MWKRSLQGKRRRMILLLFFLRAVEEAKTQGSLHGTFSLPHLHSISLAMEYHVNQVVIWCTHDIPATLSWLPRSWPDLSSTTEWPIFCPVSEYMLVYLKLICGWFGFSSFVAFFLFVHLGCSLLMQLLG